MSDRLVQAPIKERCYISCKAISKLWLLKERGVVKSFDLTLLSSENAPFAKSKEQTMKDDQQNSKERGSHCICTFEGCYWISEVPQVRRLLWPQSRL
jgi:hypothetical protein